ncbi:RagB/SusD family nutrient uptake outer membrane protein [Sphingobacterium thalpophilum]|uniref:RagB/SusD family nutrient uptake outer membrane protein n=1 Tax=Sphingobacterium thalpophilum TaxID=259 RepID=UPI0024A797BF|nr:RagB/SusD family nutrient uptake outer membrane protein [Sphingobacterium thalpophilum]
MKIYFSLCCIFTVLSCCCCGKFLEEKPDIKMVIPKSLEDAELLLNDYSTMNTGYPVYGELSADEYTVSAETFDGLLNFHDRSIYTWLDVIYDDVSQWQRPYKTVFNANQALEIMKATGSGINDTKKRKSLIGVAHFFRAFAFQQLAEVFSPAYRSTTARTEMGIPLRLSPDIDGQSVRASVQETYDQIIQDYKAASLQLPLQEGIKGRPSRPAAYAGLARTYLTMGRYDEAYVYADSCLQLRPELMNFNDLDADKDLPISRFNTEVLFAAVSATAVAMSLDNGLVDNELYGSYSTWDLRKKVFFRANSFPVDTYGYKGSYDNGMANLFVGLTTSEVYLIKAEAAVRTGKIDAALNALNALGGKRFVSDRFVPVTERNPTVLLPLILKERQRELVFRGRRWSDLKRLNLQPQFEKTLRRQVNGVVYQLQPNSPKYAFRLPEIVVNNGKIPQNIR